MIGAPADAKGIATGSGWMTSEAFVKYLQHVVTHSRPSMDDPILMILDDHASHIGLQAVQFCRDNGIIRAGFVRGVGGFDIYWTLPPKVRKTGWGVVGFLSYWGLSMTPPQGRSTGRLSDYQCFYNLSTLGPTVKWDPM